MLVAGNAKMAAIPEPAATGAMMQGFKNGVEITRALDLQKQWGGATIGGGGSKIPQAGMMISGGQLIKERPELVDAFNTALVASGRWTRNNPASAASIGSTYLGLKAPPIIERSIPFCNIDVKSGANSKGELKRFFAILMEMSPAIIGGKLPPEHFYI